MALSDFFNYDQGIPIDEEEDTAPTLQSFFRSMLPEAQLGPVQQFQESSADEIARNLGVMPQEAVMDKATQRQNLSDFSSEMGRRQRLDEGAGYPAPNANPPQILSLDDIFKLNSKAEGWDTVPGMQSMMNPGQPGRYRVEQGRTPEGLKADAAADSLRSYNKSKYGGSGNYGGAGASALNAGDEIAGLGIKAYQAGAGKRRELEGQISNIEQMIQRALVAGGGQTESPAFAELQKQLAGLKAMQSNRVNADNATLEGSTGTAAKFLAPLAEMDKADRQRQEYGQLAAMLGGGKGQPNISGGMSKDSFDLVQKVMNAQRENRRLDNADRTFAALERERGANRDDRNNRPINPSAASVKLNAQAFLPPGTSIAKLAGQDVLVKSGTNTPVPNGEMYIRQAIQKAQQQLSQRGGGANPAVVNHPAIQAISQMLKAEKEGTLEPHRNILLQRFKQNQLQIKQELMKTGMDERSAAERANLLAAGDVVGMR